MADNTTTEPKKKRRLFEDISLVQVLATALAAVTSMLLASYIGIAGSVIGVAVASVVSTTAASLYKHFLRESAEKIKEIPAVDKTHHLLEHAGKKIGLAEKDASERSEDGVQRTEDTEQGSRSDARAHENDAVKDGTAEDASTHEGSAIVDDADGVIPLDELAVQSNVVTIPVEEIEEANEPENEEIGSEAGIHTMDEEAGAPHEASTEMDDDAEIEEIERSKRRMKIGLIIVCVVSALIAVALSALVIYVSSNGEGIGTKPQTIFVHTQSEDEGRDASSKSNASYSGSENASASDASSSDASSTSSAADSSSHASASSSTAESDSSSDSSDGSHTGDDGESGFLDAPSSDGTNESGD